MKNYLKNTVKNIKNLRTSFLNNRKHLPSDHVFKCLQCGNYTVYEKNKNSYYCNNCGAKYLV